MSTKSTDLESWRRPHEIPTEWRLRKEFLRRNIDKLQPDRLECLSHCFSSIELYGVLYPPKVMEQVRELGQDISDELLISK